MCHLDSMQSGCHCFTVIVSQKAQKSCRKFVAWKVKEIIPDAPQNPNNATSALTGLAYLLRGQADLSLI